MKLKFLLFLSISIITLSQKGVYGQNNRKKLEAKRIEIQKQIASINKRLSVVNKNKVSALEELSQINRKLALRKKLTSNLRREINGISHQINKTNQQINKLESEIAEQKKNYAALIRQSYKNRERNGKLFFLFSSESFYQAFKRMQYLKQISNYRKQQALEIEKNKNELEELKQNLIADRQSKRKLFADYQQEQKKIKQEQIKQLSVVQEIKKRKNKYIAQIRAKEKQKRRIDKLIEAEIRKAITKSNKKSGKHISKHTKSSKFFLTPEGRKLADKFSSNRGILPWPVKKAYISRHFGVQQHEIFKNVKIENSGVDLATEKGAKARAVFAGKVLQIQIIPGGNVSVYIKHGNYLTIYQNLINVKVKPGDNIKTKQIIGTVATDSTTGKTEMKFLIYKNLTKLNPEKWLLKK